MWATRERMRQAKKQLAAQADASYKRSLADWKAAFPKGHFPSEDAARKLIYLAVTNAVPAWTRTRNWTVALLAFKIHFGDRVPDTAS